MDRKNFQPPKRLWPLTPENALDFQDSSGNLRLNGYYLATEDYIDLLEKILNETSNFKELKKELTEFVQDRKEFKNWLHSKFNGNTGDYNLD